MRALPAAAFALTSIVLFCGPAAADSAEDFLSGCNALANAEIHHHAGGGVSVVMPDDPAQRCWGAFSVIETVVHWVLPDNHERRAFDSCVPSEASPPELAAVFVEYLKVHPDRRRDEFANVALDAIRSTYPCKEK
jgi:hypothetical protein